MTTEALGLDTVGGRIAAARRAAMIKSPTELARLISDRGYSVTRQTLGNIERGTHLPRPDLLEHIATVLNVPADALKHGPRAGESFRIEQMRALEPDLEDQQWERIIWLAQDMAAETRVRRAAATELSGDEAALLAAYRAAQAEARTAILRVAQAASANIEETDGEAAQTATPRRRRASAS